MIDIKSKLVFVFDWDGTLFDSMRGKTQSFSAVLSSFFAEYGKSIQPDVVAAIYRKHSGKPRAEIFIEAAKVAGLQLGQSDVDEMSERLFVHNRTILAKANLFPDARRFLYALADRRVQLFISSSVPQAELDHFVGEVLPDSLRVRFSGVLGSSSGCRKGMEHVAVIRARTDTSLGDIVVIGDDEADYTLSKAAGVSCVLVDRESRFDGCFPYIVKNLDELCTLLNLPVSTLS